MEQELILSGYCKAMDSSRTVLIEEGEPDCQYGCCPHESSCPIAEKIRQAIEPTGDQ